MPDNKQRYSSQPKLALLMLVGALAAIFGTGIWSFVKGPVSGNGAGSAAAAAAILLVAAAILQWPAIITDDAPERGGEASTMRIMTLAVVLTFCVLALYQGFVAHALPSLEHQGNWIWLITAAFGGKALQKYTELQQPKQPQGERSAELQKPVLEPQAPRSATPIAKPASVGG